VIGGASQSDTYAKINLPLGRKIQVDGGKDLLLLLRDRVEVGSRAHAAVVFEAAGDFLGEVVAEFKVGRKDEPLNFRKPVDGFVKRWIKEKYQRPICLSMIGRISQVQVSAEYWRR